MTHLSENLADVLRSSDVIRAAFEVGKELDQDAYLVGGTVRDLIITSKLRYDYDFAVSGSVPDFARRFAGKVGGTFFVLDRERETSRVVSKKGFQADFAAMRGTIEEDLRLRDFTINSIAVPLRQWSVVDLIDPTGGVTDIGNSVLRASSPDSIKDDPLRILRAFRFSSIYGFSIDGALLEQIKGDAGSLTLVSPERLRTELFMILDRAGAYKTLTAMDEAGVLTVLFPEFEKWKGFYQGGWHAHDLFVHSMKTLEAMEGILESLPDYFPKHSDEISSRMGEELEAYVTRRGLLKLAALLHDSGKFYTRTLEGERYRFFGHDKAGEDVCVAVSRWFRMGRRAETVLRGLTVNHMRVLGLSMLKKVTGRAKLRFFRDAESFSREILMLALADSMATPVQGESLETMKALVRDLSGYYFEEYNKVQPEPLLTGGDIMRIFGIPEGKRIGEMLEALTEAEALGEVSSKKEAVEFLRKLGY